MNPSGLFLGSSVARRVFTALFSAAVLPLLLFAALAWHGTAAQQEIQRRRIEGAELQHTGLRVFDRLQGAHGALQWSVAAHPGPAGARTATPSVPPSPVMASGAAEPAVSATPRLLSEVLHVPDALDGNEAADPRWPSWVEQWRSVAGPTAKGSGRSLWWLAASGTDTEGRSEAGPRRVELVVGVRDAHGPAWWLARVSPAWLWDDFAPGGPAEALCVRSSEGGWIHCPPARQVQPDAAAPSFTIFLDARFGAPDWEVLAPTDSTTAATWLAWIPTQDLLGAPLLLALCATVLLTTGLTLVIVRRTLDPLDRLTTSTRQLAGGDLSARAHLDRSDEFGDLGAAFDDMADRLGRQWQAREVQVAIDRAILEGRQVEAVAGPVLDRLAALLPGVRAWLAVQDSASGRWTWRADSSVPAGVAVGGAPDVLLDPQAWTPHGLAGGLHEAIEPLVDPGTIRPSDWQSHDRVPAVLSQTLAPCVGPARLLCLLPVRWSDPGDRLRALLVLAAAEAPVIDDLTQRELLDLRHRLAVGLGAAARDLALRTAAVTDALTGLNNRAGLHRDGSLRLQSHPEGCTMLFIDLDGFKSVNDQHGHAVGDELLQEVAGRLREAVPADSVLARPGGDEFVVVLPGPPERAEELAAVVCEQLGAPFTLQSQVLVLGASIGLACAPQDGHDVGTLLRRADLAMYDAKAAGRGTWRRFALSMENLVGERAWLRSELKRALKQRALQVVYQPRVELQTGRIRGVEALARWHHVERGPISPALFIPAAEESGLIIELGREVLDVAVQQAQQWRREGLELGRVAVNVSILQLREPGFTAEVIACLDRHGLAPDALELELTESVFAGDIETILNRLEPLRARGVVVALDDFGTGYASLAALHRLPVDVMKIDRSFVTDLGRRASAEAVIRSVIALARALGKRVVAEGVETAAQRESLLALGCDEGQGWLFAKPMPAAAVREHASRTMAN